MKLNVARVPSMILFLVLSGQIASRAQEPDFAGVVAGMKRAVAFYRENLAVEGGYASQWPEDLSEGRTEHGASPTVISIQPPGTTTVGLALVEAYRATGEKVFLESAREAAGALIACQLASGGWPSDFDFDSDVARKYYLRSDRESGDTEQGKRRNLSTLDDNKTQSALRFLMELASLPESGEFEELHACVDYGFEALFAAQAPNGAWPQQWDAPADGSLPVKKASYPESWPRQYPKEKYHHFYTLNDNNILNVVELLLRAHELTGEERYLNRARKAGDFLLLAQMPDPQRGWAQQYSMDMHPVWARKFEPPALCSGESLGAVEALFQVWVASGEEKYRETLAAALDWLKQSQLPNGNWARFYELETNQPLYCEAGSYQLTYDDSNLPTHYGFQLSSSLGRKIDRMREDLSRKREDLVRRNRDPQSRESWEKRARDLRGKVKQALASQESGGYWLKDGVIDSGDFVKHMRSMAAYVEAWKMSQRE